MKRINERDIERFQESTRAALDEADGDRFIECLLQREAMTAKITEFSPSLEKNIAERLYGSETLIIERLEAERSKLFKEIDVFVKSRRVARSYASTFPIPPVTPFSQKK